jgi:hypothetical protein
LCLANRRTWSLRVFSNDILRRLSSTRDR